MRFMPRICTGVVFLTLENAAPPTCLKGERSHRLFMLATLRQSSSISYCLRPIRRKDKDPFYSFDVPHRESLQLEWLVIKWEPSALAVKDAACAAEGSDRGVCRRGTCSPGWQCHGAFSP